MTQEEIRDIYEEISDFIYHHNWRSYHCSYYCGEVNFSTSTSIHFDVYGASDQGEGTEWTEHWSLDYDGKIYTEDDVYNSIEDFKRKW